MTAELRIAILRNKSHGCLFCTKSVLQNVTVTFCSKVTGLFVLSTFASFSGIAVAVPESTIWQDQVMKKIFMQCSRIQEKYY